MRLRPKQEMLKHYAKREPKLFLQIDVWSQGDDCIPRDKNGRGMTLGRTTELMRGSDVRVLIPDSNPGNPDELATLLRKAADWVEWDHSLTSELTSNNPRTQSDKAGEPNDELNDRIVVVAEGNCRWAVVDQACDWIKDVEGLAVVFSDLPTREAAEIARRDALIGLGNQKHNLPYRPNEVSREPWEHEGAVLRQLREEGIESDDLIAMASRTAKVVKAAVSEPARREQFGNDFDPDIPF